MRAASAALALLALNLAADAPQGIGGDAQSPLLILYVGAEDCGPCRVWRRDLRARFVAQLGRHAGGYREIIAPTLARVLDDETWPEALRPFRPNAKAGAGVPLWLVIRDGRIVATAGGLSAWETSVVPLVRRQRPSPPDRQGTS